MNLNDTAWYPCVRGHSQQVNGIVSECGSIRLGWIDPKEIVGLVPTEQNKYNRERSYLLTVPFTVTVI